jgi:glycosyltransferase involved in cell wall biosynthesis
MHILYLHQYFCPPGGAGNNRSLELSEAWVAAGHQVTMVCSTAYFPERERNKGLDLHLTCKGIDVHALAVEYAHLMPFGQRVRAFLKFYRRALRLAKGLPKPDLIYASSTPLTVGELGRKLAKHWRIPFVFETVDVWPDVPIGMGIIRNPWLKVWLHRRTNLIYADAAAIVALSDGMKAQILQAGVAPDKVQVVYNGTNLQAFPYVERPQRVGVHVIYTGTVGLANGAHAIVLLCALLEARGRQDIRVTIIGGGNDLARVQGQAAQLCLSNLTFRETVPKEQVAALLAEADIGLVTFAPYPVLEANSANKFYDYLASGLPVVINYRGWQASYLRDRDCGLSSDMGDLEGLYANIIALADDPDRRQRMGQNGRRLAEDFFDRGRLQADLIKLFERVLGG